MRLRTSSDNEFLPIPINIFPGHPVRFRVKARSTVCQEFHKISRALSLARRIVPNILDDCFELSRLRQAEISLWDFRFGYSICRIFKAVTAAVEMVTDASVDDETQGPDHVVEVLARNVVVEACAPRTAFRFLDSVEILSPE